MNEISRDGRLIVLASDAGEVDGCSEECCEMHLARGLKKKKKEDD